MCARARACAHNADGAAGAHTATRQAGALGAAQRELLRADALAPRRALREQAQAATVTASSAAADVDAAAAAEHASADARAWSSSAPDPTTAMGSVGGLSALLFLAGSVRSGKSGKGGKGKADPAAGGDASAPAAAADAAGAPAMEPRAPSRRLRTCSANLSLFLLNMFAPFLPEPPPPAPRVIVVNGVRMQPDGKTPIRLHRKERVAQAVLDDESDARAQLLAIGINPNEGMLQYMAPKRLRDFYISLDAPKKHIFCKCPKVANALAMTLVHECCKPSLMSVALPWGSKKGNNQSATVRLKIIDPPYTPDDRSPKPGQLRLVLETEAGGTKAVAVTGMSANTGPDNVIVVLAGAEGQILLSFTDEPARWKWVLAINAGMHRVAPIRCMMDQAAGIMPWYPTALVTEEEPE